MLVRERGSWRGGEIKTEKGRARERESEKMWEERVRDKDGESERVRKCGRRGREIKTERARE